MLFDHLYVFLEKCIFRSSAHFLIGLFVFLMLSCMSCLYILEINPLSIASFAAVSAILWVVFLSCLWFPLLCKSFKVYLFDFIFITLGGGSKKILLRFMSKIVLPIFSTKSFVVSSLTFRSLIHFEFIFVYGVRECSNFILLHVAVQISQHHLLKRLSFLHCIFLPPCHRLIDHRCMGLSLFHWSIFLFLC